MIFCGGMPYDKAGRTPSLTVMHGKNTTVLEMEHNVVDFITLCETPWHNGKRIRGTAHSFNAFKFEFGLAEGSINGGH